MAKPTAFSKFKKYLITHKSLTLLVLLTFSVISVSWGINYYEQRQLEKRFSILENDIDRLQENIKKSIPGVTTEKTKHCRRDGEKFGGGTLRCYIELSSIAAQKEQLISSFGKSLQTNSWSGLRKSNLNEPLADSTYKNNISQIECRLRISKTGDRSAQEAIFTCFEKSARSFYPYRGD